VCSIIKFAGDALLVIWKTNEYSKKSFHSFPSRKIKGTVALDKAMGKFLDEPIEVLILQATTCMLELMSSHNNFDASEAASDVGLSLSSKNVLQLHVGIGAGEVCGCFVGGTNDVWEYFVAGEAIQDMAKAGEEAEKGELVLSSFAYEKIKTFVSDFKKTCGGHFRVMAMDANPIKQPSNLPPVTSTMESQLIKFIPPLVRTKVLSGHSEEWLAEYRRAYVMFVKIAGLNYSNKSITSILNACVRAIQESIYQFDGAILRLLADDKGTRFKICFGMPGNVHEDDGARAVLSALQIEKRLKELWKDQKELDESAKLLQPFIGIAHGPVYCGEAGSRVRSEYTAVGYKVNRAARLMGAAEKYDKGILVDEKTFEAAVQHSVTFEKLPEPIPLKGMKEPVTVFRPIGKLKARNLTKSAKMMGLDDDSSRFMHGANVTIGTRKFSVATRRKSFLVKGQKLEGRLEEKKLIVEALISTQESGNPHVIVLEGESGIGKSALVVDALTQAAELKFKICFSHASLLEQPNPHSIWKNVFKQALGIESEMNHEKIKDVIHAYLDDELAPMAALLNPLFDVEFSGNGHSGLF
jgi:class 3 adenylate cyclase